VVTKPEFLVIKEKMLVALATISVAISSPAQRMCLVCLFDFAIILTTSHQSDIGENNIVSPEAAVRVFLQTDLSLTFGTVGHQSLILKLINLI